ncbi:MAG: N-acylneuraminate-9-phosphate synthase [Myxococcales bacterium]|nr:N-acylneuraminate-9-phosphate synthase [Myxococcales bacterium]
MARSVTSFSSVEPVFVIAEAGSNWRAGAPPRDRKMALALIDVAVEAGCDAVKFQTFRPETVYAPGAGRSDYLAAAGNAEDIHAIFRDLAMPYEMVPELAAYAGARGIGFMSSPFSVADARAVDPFVAVHKIASYEINHRRLLEFVAATGKPTVISTGAAGLPEIAAALDLLRAQGAGPLCVMQCTAQYPAGLEALNLRVLPTLAARFGVAVGLSDHSTDPVTGPVGAVALGACCIEKHYTLSKRLPGPDHSFALEPHELAEMVRGIRAMEQALGRAEKAVHAAENELRAYAVRALQALRDIPAGAPLVEGENFDILRPGKNRPGMNPMRVDELAGKRATRAIPAGDGLSDGDFE